MLTRRREPTPRHVDADHRRFLEACTLVNAPCPATPTRCPPGSQVRRVFYSRHAFTLALLSSLGDRGSLKVVKHRDHPLVTRFRLISETNSTIRLDHCECHRRTSEQVSRKFENSKRLKCGQGLDLFVSKCFELNENQDKIIRPSFVVSFDKEQEVYSASLFLSLSLWTMDYTESFVSLELRFLRSNPNLV